MNLPFRQGLFSNNRFAPVYIVALGSVSISFLTRVVLLFKSFSATTWSIPAIFGAFGIGFCYDLLTASFLVIPMVLHLGFMTDKQYKSPWRWPVTAFYLLLVAILLFTNVLPKDFNKDLYKVVLYFLVARLAINIFLGTKSDAFRLQWRKFFLFADLFLIFFLLIFNAISEYFFWDEFSTRYNFIAVDYLVYTNEVIGNIRESYPVVTIISIVAILTAGLVYLLRKPLISGLQKEPPLIKRMMAVFLFLLVPALSYYFISNKWKSFSRNAYANELAGNGLFDFATAFWNNELDFFTFYKTIPDEKAFRIMRRELASPYSTFTGTDSFSIEREINYPEPEKKLNIVLISVESFSASFMKSFGNTKNITPYLDSLAEESLFFEQFYASGTRTVRGLEAMSLSIPPTPGQSIVKRQQNENLFSLGSLLKNKGYKTNYIYGGYSYFDNMKYFFGNNGYDVIDRSALLPQEIHYENIWGVADEDLFSLAAHVMDSAHASGKPFFSQVMTVSNHRPFTYPDGRIDIPPSNQSRNGAVKYTDYAINKFLLEARKKPWFENTIFVVVADHCAGSAGSVELPVTGYHIPCMIYSPRHVQPQKIKRLVAQIDLIPTILGLLNLNYTSKFFGHDVLHYPDAPERVFISTYQGLGYLKKDKLIIQKPVRKTEEFIPDFTTGNALKTTVSDSLEQEAIANYQVASWLIRHNKYGKLNK